MRIFLDAEVLKWLVNLRVIETEGKDINYKLNSNGKYEVRDDLLILDISYGLTFASLFKRLMELNVQLSSKSKDNLDLLKETKSQAAKLYNWNIINEHLMTLFEMKIDKGKLLGSS